MHLLMKIKIIYNHFFNLFISILPNKIHILLIWNHDLRYGTKTLSNELQTFEKHAFLVKNLRIMSLLKLRKYHNEVIGWSSVNAFKTDIFCWSIMSQSIWCNVVIENTFQYTSCSLKMKLLGSMKQWKKKDENDVFDNTDNFCYLVDFEPSCQHQLCLQALLVSPIEMIEYLDCRKILCCPQSIQHTWKPISTNSRHMEFIRKAWFNSKKKWLKKYQNPPISAITNFASCIIYEFKNILFLEPRM